MPWELGELGRRCAGACDVPDVDDDPAGGVAGVFDQPQRFPGGRELDQGRNSMPRRAPASAACVASRANSAAQRPASHGAPLVSGVTLR